MMKLNVIILFFFIAQASSASFFEEFRGAMNSVQDSFGRLISDVYTDVSQTIGCTILAVKQVLAFDKTFNESSDYNRRCGGQTRPVTQELPKLDKKNEAYSYINSINANHELENIETEFKSETDRLMTISSLLKREVENISKDLKLNIKIEPEPQEPIRSIWHNLKILHDVEHSYKNYAHLSEIQHVLDETLNIMKVNSIDANESDDDKIQTIVKDLGKNSKHVLTEVDDQFAEWKKEEKNENMRKHESLSNDKNKNASNINVSEIIKENKTDSSTVSPISSTTTTPLPEFEAFENYVLSQLGPKDSEDKKAALEEATKLIKDSKYRNKVFDSLAKAESTSTDLFDHPELFNFGT
ncbi:uncharacterized protein LOC106134689 [Amyelois transitella]|uniref:uncharacterized protein LOC106134689 n=1 Tax=Amyelois transitella TaxID=680683 RepID=UPI00067DB578|nr:uncharacterized protein LOC106134689 [Amyelois transitella]